MNLDQILALTHAGYTKDEINALAGTEEKPKLAPAPAPAPEVKKDAPADFSAILADAIAKAIAAQKPDPAPEPKPEPKAEPKQEPKQEPKPEDATARILAALGIAAQGVAIPKEETLEERMANSLRVALGIPEEKKKEE